MGFPAEQLFERFFHQLRMIVRGSPDLLEPLAHRSPVSDFFKLEVVISE